MIFSNETISVIPKILNGRDVYFILMTDIRRNSTEEDRQTGALSHIIGLLAGFFGTIVFYCAVEDDFVKENAAEATNWQLSVIVYSVILSIVTGFSGFTFVFLFLNLCFSGIAAKKALNGETWSYPLSLNLFSVDTESSESYRIKDDDNVERVKKLYRNGVIDEQEMEERIERALKYNQSRKSSERLSESTEKEYSYN